MPPQSPTPNGARREWDGLEILILRQHDQIANRDVRRSRQHEQQSFRHVFRAQAGMRRDPTFDLLRLRQSPKLVQHRAGRQRADPDIVRRNLSSDAVHERLNRVLRRGIDGFPGNRLMPGRCRSGQNAVRSSAASSRRRRRASRQWTRSAVRRPTPSPAPSACRQISRPAPTLRLQRQRDAPPRGQCPNSRL